jgi:hypothetical protein
MNFWLGVGIFAAGYAGSIFTWPKIKEWANGAEAEIVALKAKIEGLKGRL